MVIDKACELIKNATRTTAFTGAGISVESGIPPFRGEGGIWEKYSMNCFSLSFYKQQPEQAWKDIFEIFYQYTIEVNPNMAHIALAKMQEKGLIADIITQNIDNLHQKAGSSNIIEFHGNSSRFICNNCNTYISTDEFKITKDKAPRCAKCGGILKPDFVFFEEEIPQQAHIKSNYAAENSDLFIIVGTSGVVYPAAYIPELAKKNGAKIIEINTKSSRYTNLISDVFIQDKACNALTQILNKL